MSKTSALKTKKLPRFAKWLLGWVLLCLFATGLVYLWRVIFSLSTLPALEFTFATIGVCSLVYLAVFVIFCLFREKSLNARAAMLVFLFGLLFCFGAAPMQVPDETSHYLRAYAISNGHFMYDYLEQYPNEVSLLIEAFPQHMNHQITYANHALATGTLTQYFANLQGGLQAVSPAVSPIMFMLLPYAPGAAFMAVGRVFGLSALGQMYAARIANLAIYALLCYFAFKNATRFKGLLFCFAFLPLSLFMAASCSYDSLMLGLIWLLLSLIFKDKIDNRTLVLFAIILVIIVYIKPINILLALVLLLVPKNSWHVKPKKYILVIAFMLATGLIYWLATYTDGTLLKTPNWPELPRGSGLAANPSQQLSYVLQNPLRFIAVAVNTFFEENGFFFKMGLLGSMDLQLPILSGLSVLVIAFAAVQSGVHSPLAQNEKPTKLAAWLVALAVLYSASIMAGMYVQVNDLYSIRITELQPRYFLPAFLMLALACAQFLSHRVRAQASGALAALRAEKTVLIVCMGLAALAAILLFQNYWVGQWIPKAEGGYILVNMFT